MGSFIGEDSREVSQRQTKAAMNGSTLPLDFEHRIQRTASRAIMAAEDDFMSRNRNLTLVLALAAGFLGGFLSRYLTLPSVHAQAQPPSALEIRAQQFSVVDAKGRVIGTFTAITRDGDFGGPAFPRVALVDPAGRELWSAGGKGLRPLAENSK